MPTPTLRKQRQAHLQKKKEKVHQQAQILRSFRWVILIFLTPALFLMANVSVAAPALPSSVLGQLWAFTMGALGLGGVLLWAAPRLLESRSYFLPLFFLHLPLLLSVTAILQFVHHLR